MEIITREAALAAVSDADLRRIERFLYRDARLLDERRYSDWLKIWRPEADYVVFNRSVPEPKHGTSTPLDQEFRARGGLQFTEDTKSSLTYRINRLNSGLTFTETPPGRTVRLVTNIEAWHGDAPHQFKVESCLHCNRTRKERQVENFYARRKDILAYQNDEMSLLQRHVFINETVLGAHALTILF